MAKTSRKWTLFYTRNSWERRRTEIGMQQFDSELDMLFWIGKNPQVVRSGINLNYIVTPDGTVTQRPNDLYERIDVLRKEQIEAEQQAVKQEERTERDRRIAIAKGAAKARQTRKENARLKEAQCQQT